ncbi:MAG: HK97 family phage prohead protease [Coriobacteriia bacterium]|nr:HK97 family phage prohead protease [Coriobacteriia bacterium]
MIERRSIELRGAGIGPGASAPGPGLISGRAIVYDSRSELLEGTYREVIRPGSIRLRDDLLVLAGHDHQHVLGRVNSGTARAWQDGAGVLFEAELPDTVYARDLAASMARGDVCQCSFAMIVNADEFYVDGATVVREILSADVLELSIVAMPAYKATEATIT